MDLWALEGGYCKDRGRLSHGLAIPRDALKLQTAQPYVWGLLPSRLVLKKYTRSELTPEPAYQGALRYTGSFNRRQQPSWSWQAFLKFLPRIKRTT